MNVYWKQEWCGQEGGVLLTQPRCHSFTCRIKTMLLTVRHWHLFLIWSLVVTSTRCCQQPQAPMGSWYVLVPIPCLSSSVPGEMCGVHCPSTAFCFVLSWTRLPVNKHLQADKWEYNWLSMKKNRFISVWQAQTDHFVNPGQARQKMLEASRETPKRMYSCFKAATERPSTKLGGTGLSALRRPDLGPPGPRTDWTGSRWERGSQHLSPPPPCTQSYSSTLLPSTYNIS